jgi:hypothetical protein
MKIINLVMPKSFINSIDFNMNIIKILNLKFYYFDEMHTGEYNL